MLKSVLAGAAALGAVQTVAGATELEAGTIGNPAPANVGATFLGGFAVIGAPSRSESYEVKGTLAPGLVIAGLSGDLVNRASVLITGKPTQVGSFTLKIRAWEGINKTKKGGSLTFDYTIIVGEAVETAPFITRHPKGLVVTVGEPASFEVQVSGSPSPTFQWSKNGVVLPGASSAIFSIGAVTTSDAGEYTVRATNSRGNVTSFGANLEVIEPIDPPRIEITASPFSADVELGESVSFSVTANAPDELTYQWYRHRSGEFEPQILTSETGVSLAINAASTIDMGFYFARLTSGSLTMDSAAAILTVAGGSSRLANLSTRGNVPAGGELTPGFVLRGDGVKELIIRAVGPELADFGVGTAMADPALALVPLGGSTPSLTNDNWEDAANSIQLAATSASLGAFPLNPGSRDAAVLSSVSLPNAAGTKGFTVQITSTSGAAGIALAEVYDPDGTGGSAQLINISARGFSGVGADVLAPGFVIDGDGAKTMLIRVVGPTLGGFGVPDTMTDPRLEVIPSGQSFAIASNDNWEGTTALKAAFQTTGAFTFGDDASLDAAVVVRLPPGAYTVRPAGADDGTGVILVEAFEVLIP